MADSGMKKSLKKIVLGLTLNALFIGMLSLNWGCKALPTDNKTWQGEEQVEVTFGASTATVSLKGLHISTYEDVEGVKLSDIVNKAQLVTSTQAQACFFNFIAVDAYDMSKMAIKWQKSLPAWDDMKKGYFYDSGSSSGLCAKWEAGTQPGDYGRFYNVRLMNGGIIQILEDDVL
jgi:hypothetical protein